jgi:polyketide cyclase/dehydrase/lipid transport protein
MHLSITETLEAPLEAVFDIISDPRRRLEWQSSLRSVHVRSDGPPRVGYAWYELTRGGLRFDLEITDFERPMHWAERGSGRLADARLDVRFEGLPGVSGAARTTVVLDVTVDFKGALKLVSPVVRRLMPVALRADLRRVEALVPRTGSSYR